MAEQQPLALPAPEDVDTTKLEVNSTVKLDKLGVSVLPCLLINDADPLYSQ